MKFTGVTLFLIILAISASAAKQVSLAKFELKEHPRLLAEKADNLGLLGQKDAALKTLAEVLKDFPESPDFKKTEDKLIQWSTGK